MNDRTPLESILTNWQNRALIVAGVGVVLCIIAAIVNVEQFLQSYLLGFLFWWMVTVGCLGLLMLYYMVGGYWGNAAKPLLESGSLLVPLAAVFFLPVALGLEVLYPWTHGEHLAPGRTISVNSPFFQAQPDTQLAIPGKAAWLNAPFFYGRAVAYFVIWFVFAWLLRGDPAETEAEHPRWRRLLSAGGLVAMFLTITFAAMDWGMSLDPAWFSSIYGALLAIGGALAAMALVTMTLANLIRDQQPAAGIIPTTTIADLGTLMLAFLMLWTYFAFSQYLIIWSGNLPEENFWYVTRLQGGWQWLGGGLIVFQFFVPFFLLLSRDLKQNPRALGGVALWVFVMQLVHLLWIITPSFHPQGFRIHWADIAAPVAVGGLWLSGFLWIVRRRLPPLLARMSS